MQKRDAFAFGTDAGSVIDESDPFAAAAVECSIQIVDGEADVMDAGPAFGDELGNGRIGSLSLEQLDQGVAGASPST